MGRERGREETTSSETERERRRKRNVHRLAAALLIMSRGAAPQLPPAPQLSSTRGRLKLKAGELVTNSSHVGATCSLTKADDNMADNKKGGREGETRL